MKKICENCAYYDQFDHDNNYGFCHRYPPVPTYEDERIIQSYYSKTIYFSWCGEWKERKEKKEYENDK